MIIFWNRNLKAFIIRWSIVFSMVKRKTLASTDDLFDQGYKLSYFSEDLSKYVENQVKSVEKGYKVSKTLNKWFKMDIFHVEMFEPFCPECFSKFMVKNGS